MGKKSKIEGRCLGLRRVRNYATSFHNFSQNYFTPFSSSQSGEANDESAARHINYLTIKKDLSFRGVLLLENISKSLKLTEVEGPPSRFNAFSNPNDINTLCN